MICTCDNCRYTFCPDSLPLACPDCGSENVREATLEEKDWYHDLEQEKMHNPMLLDKIKAS